MERLRKVAAKLCLRVRLSEQYCVSYDTIMRFDRVVHAEGVRFILAFPGSVVAVFFSSKTLWSIVEEAGALLAVYDSVDTINRLLKEEEEEEELEG